MSRIHALFVVVAIMATSPALLASSDDQLTGQEFKPGETATVIPWTQSELISAANQMTALGGDGAAVLAAVGNETLTVGWFSAPSGGVAGASDSDTIGIEPNSSGFLAKGAILKHEWEHVQNAVNANDILDPLTSSVPCGKMLHAGMTMDAANDLCGVCTADMSDEDKEALNKLKDNLEASVNDLIIEAVKAGCTEQAPSIDTEPCECLDDA